MNEFDAQILPSLKHAIHEFIKRENFLRDTKQSIINHTTSINWINQQLITKRLSQANIAEYKHQIRYHEINLAFLYNDIL